MPISKKSKIVYVIENGDEFDTLEEAKQNQVRLEVVDYLIRADFGRNAIISDDGDWQLEYRILADEILQHWESLQKIIASKGVVK